ncbi:transducin beta-like protein 3 [Cryptosporidium felis]|nr:transducin beta-like protein 3 [Cryptosporidium felis]
MNASTTNTDDSNPILADTNVNNNSITIDENGKDPILSSSWTKYKVFKKLYSGGKVEYDSTSKLLFTLCDGCILGVSIEKGPFVISTIGPYEQDKSMGTEHAEEIVTFGFFNKKAENKQIVTVGPKNIFRLWKVITKHDDLGLLTFLDFEYVRSWKSGRSGIGEIEFDNTGQYVSTGGTDGTIQIYDAVGGFITHNFKGHKSLITKIKFHPKRWLLFSTCVEGIISIYDLTINKIIVSVNHHFSVIHSFDLFETKSDTSLGGMVTSGADNMINIWDLDQIPNSDIIGVLSSHSNEDGSPKKRKKDGNFKVYTEFKPIKQIHSKETAFSIKCTRNEFSSGKLNPEDGIQAKNNPWIIIAGNEKSGVQIWNPIKGNPIKEISPSNYSCNQSAILYMFLDRMDEDKGNSKSLLILITEDRNIIILSYPSFRLFTTFFGNTPDYIQLALFNDNTCSKECGNDDLLLPSEKTMQPSIKCVVLDSTETPQIMSLTKFPYFKSPLIGHSSTVLTMDISRCSKFIATGSKDETIKIWSTQSQECLATLTGHTSFITALCFQKKPFVPGNSTFYLYSASNDNTVKSWNLSSIVSRENSEPKKEKKSKNSNKESDPNQIIAIHNVIAHKKEVNHINISHNDKFLATCSEDKTLKIWSLPELKQQGICKGHQSGVWQCSFSPIEKLVASASSDGTIKLWNLGSFACLKTLQGHDGPVLQVDFLGNGLQLLSCGSDNLIKLWNVTTGECIKSFSGHDDKIWTLNLLKESKITKNTDKDSGNNPNQTLSKTRFMATGGSDSQMILWVDNTKQIDNEENLKNLKRIEDLNEIDMLFNKKEYFSALNLSLSQKLQFKTYLILEKVLKQDIFEESKGQDDDGFNRNYIADWIQNLNTQDLSTLFNFMLEWVTISKTVWLSNSLMYLILTKVKPEELYKIEGFVQIVQAFRSYNSKIQIHLSTLNQKSYILDYLFLSNQISTSKNNQTSKYQDDALNLTLDVLFKGE